MSFDFTGYSLFDIVGVTGFLFYLAAYTSLTMKWLEGHSLRYFTLNLCASSCVLISLTSHFNIASALIQIFWIVISCIGLCMVCTRKIKNRRARHSSQKAAPPPKCAQAPDLVRQVQGHGQPRLVISEPHSSAVTFDHFAHNRQTKPRAARI